MRILAHLLGWLCVLAMPASAYLLSRPAFAQERLAHYYETAPTTLKFRWTESTGPVTGYEVCVHRVCGTGESGTRWTVCEGSLDNEAVVPVVEWVTFYVQVRAIGEATDHYSEYSEASIPMTVNPNPADIDNNCVVGGSDFIDLSQSWGAAAVLP